MAVQDIESDTERRGNVSNPPPTLKSPARGGAFLFPVKTVAEDLFLCLLCRMDRLGPAEEKILCHLGPVANSYAIH